ncbi:MAG: response regulator [Marinicella sp.]
MGKLLQPKKNASIKILVVDDETDARLSLKNELEKKYEVMTADDGIEAQLMLECNNDFDLIVSDQAMPMMSGVKLFEWVEQAHPHTPKILMVEISEYSEQVKSQSQDINFFCLNKKLSHDKLMAAIELAVIGVSPICDPSMLMANDVSDEKDEHDEVELEVQSRGCNMAVLDTNTKNWPLYDKLTKKSDLIKEVVYYRNPQLLLERVKKDESLGVVCINFNTKDNEVNDVIEKINWLKQHPNVLLMCGIQQTKAAIEYQFKGVVFQHIMYPCASSKLLFEIEDCAKQFLVDYEPNDTAETAETDAVKPKNVHNIIKLPTSQLKEATL